MPRGFQVTRQDGGYLLVGSIDEAGEFDALMADESSVMRINLAGLQSINSLGLRRLILFMKSLGDRAVELTECPPVFIEAVNVTPQAVGGIGKVGRIKSALIPYNCPADHEQMFTVPISAIQDGKSVHVPTQKCGTCGGAMTADLESDVDEFFFFLTV